MHTYGYISSKWGVQAYGKFRAGKIVCSIVWMVGFAYRVGAAMIMKCSYGRLSRTLRMPWHIRCSAFCRACGTL